MNRECNGTFYGSGPTKRYKCLWDGRAIYVTRKPTTCPLCKRRIDATHGGRYQRVRRA